MEISSQKYSFVVEREVVQITADMLTNYGLELWMESKGFRCRTEMPASEYGLDESRFTWPPIQPGINFRPYAEPESETVFAHVGDYLVFSGYGSVEVMTSEDFNKAQATPVAE